MDHQSRRRGRPTILIIVRALRRPGPGGLKRSGSTNRLNETLFFSAVLFSSSKSSSVKRMVLGILAFENGLIILNMKTQPFLNIEIVTDLKMLIKYNLYWL
ncbi:MAG TPA: hypothetical protein DC013_08640 [Ruminococcaceae bacterium]|jgi:hypothetical protein|nr:hypothetical protein [Oscillospiraceae bacterium]